MLIYKRTPLNVKKQKKTARNARHTTHIDSVRHDMRSLKTSDNTQHATIDIIYTAQNLVCSEPREHTTHDAC